ncbi:caspase family protein [Ruegeria sp. Ofav3-42]|uniref:caspase family protein n=1 Tax=Ruegeria sp. Ofav3-42 TaxID=2917759 RepID=UPI001EF5B90A|nr:caspase family protein [Ruegeria sp. Ofav3-42]MCG7521626.1 caspase family protein [Ruegeria sp. Ofav3-42]
MAIRLDIQSSDLDDEALSTFVAQLDRELNNAAGVRSARAKRKPAPGERAFELLLDPQLWIEVGQSAAVSSLIQVLKAYVIREKSVKFALRTEGGAEIAFDAKNFSEEQVFNVLSKLAPDASQTSSQSVAETDQLDVTIELFDPPQKQTEHSQTKRKIAIVVGMDNFEDPELDDLSYARNDATALHNLLQGETGEQFDHVELITQGNHSDALTTIERITTETQRSDLLLIYYAGHGLVRNQKLHLAFTNTRSDLVHSTALKYGNLLDVVEQAAARFRLVILDCCYAGAAGEDASRSALSEQLKMELGANSRTLVMTSATSTQVAREAKSYRHGVFTKYLLDGLKGEADRNGDGSVDTRELFDYLEEMMQVEHLQRPQKFNFSGSGAVTLRKTGLQPHRDLARRLRKQVNDLQHEGLLSESQSDRITGLLKLNLDQMDPVQRRRFRLLEAHLIDDFKPGLFFDEWERLSVSKTSTPRKQSKQPPPETSNAVKFGEKWAHLMSGANEAITSAKQRARETKDTLQNKMSDSETQTSATPKKRPWKSLTAWDKFMRVCSYIGLLFVVLFVFLFIVASGM